ncbi:pyridoxamine 5'-phosphate oxidase family protein [Georgenia satyanarayanai]|uniref:pyridoxamine 5'-phosphate oxidase family protein n=1 Tax=Georgenia satyanarayanai TaxID=860221 RepID=UPI001264C9D7|nr:pyridoxamine 5'-phosphate oxidase family protein [Georgenia satyanarayanai]
MVLTREDRERFLAEPHIGALSVAGEPGRAPLVVPLWYQYTPGGRLWVLTGGQSRKARLIATAGRFSLMAERVRPTVRYVSVEGPVTGVLPQTDERLVEMTYRYLSGEAAEGYLAMARRDLGDHVVIEMQPERWLSADLG